MANTRQIGALSGLRWLIAATAIEHRLVIVTFNAKHYQSVNTLRIDAFKPRQMSEVCRIGTGYIARGSSSIHGKGKSGTNRGQTAFFVFPKGNRWSVPDIPHRKNRPNTHNNLHRRCNRNEKLVLNIEFFNTIGQERKLRHPPESGRLWS